MTFITDSGRLSVAEERLRTTSSTVDSGEA